MFATLSLPRLIFGAGALGALPDELAALGVSRPLLLSDRGLERAGLMAAAFAVLPGAAPHLDVPENPCLADADTALASFRAAGCDGVVALGGGSVIDTAKFVAALAGLPAAARAVDLQGRPEQIGDVCPLVAVPTTVGTGSESSPVAALHSEPGAPAAGTRSIRLVPRVAVCDPDLVRTLPRWMVAATGVDALSHCIEGFLAEPANPFVDALALDGLSRAWAAIAAAIEPVADAARGELMAAAFAGGAAIHKGLGPAHAVAVACGDQHLHHGTLIAAALPLTLALVLPHVPAKADRAAAAMGLARGSDIPDALRSLNHTLGLPAGYHEAGYRPGPVKSLVDRALASHFNRSSPYVPTREEYRAVITTLVG